MPTEIVVLVDNMRLNGYLGDTPTAQALADALPIEGKRPALGRGDLLSRAPGGGGPGRHRRGGGERRGPGLLAHAAGPSASSSA